MMPNADPVPRVTERVAAEGLTYLEPAALLDLYRAVRQLERDRVPGSMIEAGCALGGSAIVLASAKSPLRPMRIYDVFGMIPPPTDADGADVHARYETIRSGQSSGIGGAAYYGYEENLYEKVAAAFERHRIPLEHNDVQLIRGLFQDTLRVDGPVALAHLDGDWYESTLTCLDRIAPRLSPGGRLVIDDYDAWSGCRRAVDEYFAGRDAEFEQVRHSRLHIIRRPNPAAGD